MFPTNSIEIIIRNLHSCLWYLGSDALALQTICTPTSMGNISLEYTVETQLTLVPCQFRILLYLWILNRLHSLL